MGAVSYETVTADGLKRDVLFCYDLKLPADFKPTAQARCHSQNPITWHITAADGCWPSAASVAGYAFTDVRDQAIL